jgi:hypothetical protein
MPLQWTVLVDASVGLAARPENDQKKQSTVSRREMLNAGLRLRAPGSALPACPAATFRNICLTKQDGVSVHG